ncbi:MAG: peptidylprolyl isomerase [Saprospiraceae bacterium]|nr:peptidylprolyl isomerase [Saprospiraceae bacterium]
MSKNLVLVLIITFLCNIIYAQKDEVLFTVNKTPVNVSEFRYIYEKSNNKNADYSEKSLNESLDLYIRFKLKVAKARELRMDTLPSLTTELNSYKQQLADSYLMDKEVNEKLAKQLFDRMKTDVRVAHIFIADNHVDSIKALMKVNEIKTRLKNGDNFEDLVKLYSEDESTKKTGGDLGFLAPMYPNGFYPLENLVYSLKKGEVGGPVRTSAGWHFVKILDTRPARGEMEIAQILIRISKTVDDGFAKARIDSVYEALKKGADFGEMAKKFSDDRNTAAKGGFLGFITIGTYDENFENHVFALTKDGEYTEPFKTALGYHIVKRISKRDFSDFDAVKKSLMTKVSRNERYGIAKNHLIEKIKKDYHFTQSTPVYKEYTDSINTDRFYTNNWTAPKIKNATIFTLGEQNYTTDQLSQYLADNSRRRVRMNKSVLPIIAFKELYDEFISDKAIEYEQGKLDEKYPDYKALTREYEEGFLFFEVTNREIWNKASMDSVGIEKYFNEHRDNYKWEERARLLHYTIKASSPEELNSVYEHAKTYSPEQLQKKYSREKVTYTSQLIEKSNQGEMNGLMWKAGAMSLLERKGDGKVGSFDKVESIEPPVRKELKEARGFVIADYQDYLDKLWVEKLKKEYNVTVNQKVFDSLIKH